MGKYATLVACRVCGKWHETRKRPRREVCPFCGAESRYKGKPVKV